MTASRREVAVVLGLLAACAVYFLVVFLPMASDIEIIGFGGRQSGQGFLVSEIWDGSPAQAAGLRTGDRITAQDGTPISAWHHLYRSNARSYVERRHRLRGAIIRYDLVRDGRAQTAEQDGPDPGFQRPGRLHPGVQDQGARRLPGVHLLLLHDPVADQR
jgi:predicted metalloprotease with PDZ domain